MGTDVGGRYDNGSEVVGCGSRLLQETEDRRRQLRRMLQDTELEADCEGTVTIDAVLAEVDIIIAADTP
jgi:Arc/MetJ-type ribon-helix-helix transcriptional regulator